MEVTQSYQEHSTTPSYGNSPYSHKTLPVPHHYMFGSHGYWWKCGPWIHAHTSQHVQSAVTSCMIVQSRWLQLLNWIIGNNGTHLVRLRSWYLEYQFPVKLMNYKKTTACHGRVVHHAMVATRQESWEVVDVKLLCRWFLVSSFRLAWYMLTYALDLADFDKNRYTLLTACFIRQYDRHSRRIGILL